MRRGSAARTAARCHGADVREAPPHWRRSVPGAACCVHRSSRAHGVAAAAIAGGSVRTRWPLGSNTRISPYSVRFQSRRQIPKRVPPHARDRQHGERFGRETLGRIDQQHRQRRFGALAAGARHHLGQRSAAMRTAGIDRDHPGLGSGRGARTLEQREARRVPCGELAARSTARQHQGDERRQRHRGEEPAQRRDRAARERHFKRRPAPPFAPPCRRRSSASVNSSMSPSSTAGRLCVERLMR